MIDTPKKSLVIVCGGPSEERGISLNSARSLFDHIDQNSYAVSLIYFNPNLEAFLISEHQIYSNTPMDFDYLLKDSRQRLTTLQLRQKLQSTDIVFPAIHGTFGEDGKLQQMLDEWGVKYVGSGVSACALTNDKHQCSLFLKQHGFFTLPNIALQRGERLPKLPVGKYVVKPQNGGSSIGVHIFETADQLEEKIQKVWALDEYAVIEPFCEGIEFTVIVLENGKGEAVALVPTEIEFQGDTFFDYRKKYLATGETTYHCPPRFPAEKVSEIRRQAEEIFGLLKMRDMARLDGWLMPDGKIWFSDINAISGMEQNSFLFLQPGLLGFSHRQTLQYILEKKITRRVKDGLVREAIPVIFGGSTAERQVSIMSGTNVLLKLKSSAQYESLAYFLEQDDESLYQIPHFLYLHHAGNEISPLIQEYITSGLPQVPEDIFPRLGISRDDLDEPLFVPKKESFESLAQKYSFFFLGLHGGVGENGILQKKLDALGVAYNGPGSEASALCMDKFLTGERVMQAGVEGVRTARKMLVRLDESASDVWARLRAADFPESVILKPRLDGCSAGILKIHSSTQLEQYMAFLRGDFTFIPAQAIHHSHGQIGLPTEKIEEVLIEEFIETDRVTIRHLELHWQEKTKWIEVTCGVVGEKGNLHAMNPSQTVADLDILSLEEKFMGGTGVNFTPPPREFVSAEIVERAKKRLEKVAEALGIAGYSRIDLFLNRETGELILIEANSLPGLTPSTVIFHQALMENPSLLPRDFLEKIIALGKLARSRAL